MGTPAATGSVGPPERTPPVAASSVGAPEGTTIAGTRTDPDGTARASGSAWMYALAGWLLAVTQLDRSSGGVSEAEIRGRLPFGALGELDRDPDTMTVRGLRRLPAIGPARALAIARARWEDGLSGGPESWDSIRGIGPETVAAIRRHLAGPQGADSATAPSRRAADAAPPGSAGAGADGSSGDGAPRVRGSSARLDG